MAESSLSLTRTQLRQEVGHDLGYSRTVADWSTSEVADIDTIVNRGMRQFYFPPIVPGESQSHEWRFMRPITTLTTIATYSTGTVTVATGTCTLAVGTWPTWAYTHGKLLIDSVEYTISVRVDGSELTVVGDDVAAGTSYSLEHDGNYDMDDNYGGIEGNLTFASGEGSYPPIVIVGETAIRKLRQQDDNSARPQFAAVRPKLPTGTTGQRFEMMLYPRPNSAYVLTYKMMILDNALTETTNEYHLGGMMHSETMLSSCLAIAEMQVENRKAERWDIFMNNLATSISNDKKSSGIDYFGYNGDDSDDRETQRGKSLNLVTYNGDSTA